MDAETMKAIELTTKQVEQAVHKALEHKVKTTEQYTEAI